jgi:D-arginine dehydrogenase
VQQPYDFLICGSGIAGASIAAELAVGALVLVAEREDAHGYHTTGRSAAMYIESYGNAVIRRITAASRAFFDAPPDGFAEHPLLTPRACLTIARADQLRALDELEAAIAATGTRHQRISGDEARRLVPVLRDTVAAAVMEPDAADIDVGALHAGYLRLARSRGAEFRNDAEVLALEPHPEGWRARLKGGDDVIARVVVNAAGAWADEVAVLAGLAPIGLSPLRRTALLIEAPADQDFARWPVVIDAEETFYFKAESGRLLASPADETPSPPTDAAPDEMDIAVCIDRIQAATTLPVRRLIRSWAGLRTFAPDRTQVIGYDPAAAGFFWFAGQGGYGMQTAPAAARLAAALARHEAVPADIAARGLTAGDVSPVRLR